MITVNVLYFGAVREACKVAHEKISLESGTTVDGLVDQLQIDYPPLADFRKRVRMAVNESIAPASTILDDGDTVAFIPQVAGGSDVYCRLTDEPLSVDEVLNAISGPSQGGAVIFVGTVRNNNNGHEVTKLYYEAYPAMVHRTLTRTSSKSVNDRPTVCELPWHTGPVNCASVMRRLSSVLRLLTARPRSTPLACASEPAQTGCADMEEGVRTRRC